jgi:hypothetical protein
MQRKVTYKIFEMTSIEEAVIIILFSTISVNCCQDGIDNVLPITACASQIGTEFIISA